MSDHAGGSSAKRFRFSAARAAIAIAASGVTFAVLLPFDPAIFFWCDRAIQPASGGTAAQLLDGLRNYSQLLSVVTICIVIAAFDRRRTRVLMAVLVAQLLAMLVFNGVKYSVARHRPESAVINLSVNQAHVGDLRVGWTWIGWQPINSNRAAQSFPSGHTAAAFALTGVLAFYYSRIAWMLWILAAGCGFSRVIEHQHWLTDCVAGALIGYLAAVAALSIAQRLGGGAGQPIGPSRISGRG